MKFWRNKTAKNKLKSKFVRAFEHCESNSFLWRWRGAAIFAVPLLCLSTQRSYWEGFSWLDIYCDIYHDIYCDIYHGIFYKKKEGELYDDCKGF